MGEPTWPAPVKFAIQSSWENTPHLSEQSRAEMLEGIPAYQRDSRTKGIPQLGAGAIYPVAEEDILCEPFVIPDWMPQCYALDVGWNRTAAIWGAWDQDSDVVYLYAEHYRGQAEPAIHAQAIRSRGDWIPGVIDPASRGRNQIDGDNLLRIYRDDLALSLEKANNAVESGLYEVWTRLSTGRLKVFKTLQHWLQEYRIYRRDESGKIVKEHDHLMDATRYLVMSGLSRAVVRPPTMWKQRGQSNNHAYEYDPMK